MRTPGGQTVLRAAVEAVIEVILHPIGHRQLAVLDCPPAGSAARGENISSWVCWYVGHTGRQRPHRMHPGLIIIRQVQAENLLAGCGFV